MDEEVDEHGEQLHQVSVVILEGRHLGIKEARSEVIISIGNRKKTIRTRKNTTNRQHYNDFCVFLFHLPLKVLLDKILTVRVYKTSRRKKLVGSFSVDLATVWSQPNHQFYHKWAVLVDPTKVTKGVKGFLKCDIGVITRGAVIKPPEDIEDDSLAKNVLVPSGEMQDRQRVKLVFSVFRGDTIGNLKLSRPYVQITYGRNVRKTRAAKSQKSPVWNEKLVFLDHFPPLTQNILVEIFDRKKSKRESLGNAKLNIRGLYELGERGFLPTFGPNFLYLYRPFKKSERYRNGDTSPNAFTYMGRVLLALQTKVITGEQSLFDKEENRFPTLIDPLDERRYFQYHDFILFAAIFDALFFDSKLRKNVKVRVTLGPKKMQAEPHVKRKEKRKFGTEEISKPVNFNDGNTTPKQKVTKGTGTKKYGFIDFSGKFPCVSVLLDWPDFLGRTYCSNVVQKVIRNCTNQINTIKSELWYEAEHSSESNEKLKATLLDLSNGCKSILPLTKVRKSEDTNLSRKRKIVYHREIDAIAREAKMESNQTHFETEEAIRKISGYLSRLKKYAEDPENSFPDIEIWLLQKKKVFSQCRIVTDDVTFSSDDNSMGIISGRTKTLLFRAKNGKLQAKLDIFVWFGLAKDFYENMKQLTGNFNQVVPSPTDLQMPFLVTFVEEHRCQCRAHIFQGTFNGFGRKGSANPFVRIIIGGQAQQTLMRKATLSPIWDETLVLPLTLHGPPAFLRDNPMSITVEIFHRTSHNRLKLMGRSFIRPLITLKDVTPEPPQMKWVTIRGKTKEVGKVLIATEILEISNSLTKLQPTQTLGKKGTKTYIRIPDSIRPHINEYLLDVFFWGIRQKKKTRSKQTKLFVVLECGENMIRSRVVNRTLQARNFPGPSQIVKIYLPQNPEYIPPLSVTLFHINCSQKKKVATSLIPNAGHFLHPSADTNGRKKEKENLSICKKGKIRPEKKEMKEEKQTQRMEKVAIMEKIWHFFVSLFVIPYCYCKSKLPEKETSALTTKRDHFDISREEQMTEEEKSWWLKFVAAERSPEYSPGVPALVIYRDELEVQPQFRKFQDYLYTFEMVKERKKKPGPLVWTTVKAVVGLYKWPPKNKETGNETQGVILMNDHNNAVFNFLLRVYIIRGKNLASKDVNGKSNPYLFLQLGKQKIKDRDSYHPKQINPTFAKCYEMRGAFPENYLLRIKVIDRGFRSKDNLIGETSIDLENRFYSKYHANCGLAKTFERQGFNAWRDTSLPTKILEQLCKRLNLQRPVYRNTHVVVEGHEFETEVSEAIPEKEEIQALMVLNRWHEMPIYGFHLVPEHVETRSLYHPSIPGIVQGKLQLWVDIFPYDHPGHTPPKVDLTPQSPVAMELRAIVWNVQGPFVVKGRVSDIYVKGWILSLEEEQQRTDLQHKGKNGKTNFNWRFIFHFNYIPAERKIVVGEKKAGEMEVEERKVHCKLEIQMWDNDQFGEDGLGNLILELCSMPPGAKMPNRCTLKMLKPSANKINLFKIRKIRGWWPFRRLKVTERVNNEFELTGKIDLELEILTAAEARQQQVGKGREQSNVLLPPNQSEKKWNYNPITTVHTILQKNKKFLIQCLKLLGVICLTLLTIYAYFKFSGKEGKVP